jgi:hypothetical protein
MKLFHLLLCLTLSACATGPRRQGLAEVVSPEEPPGIASSDADGEQLAGPFSAGLMLGAGVPIEGSGVEPLQLAAASLKVIEVQGRAANIYGLGGVSTSIPQDSEASPKVRGAWGIGVGLELTPGNLLYSVDFCAGALWRTGVNGTLLSAGFVISPKM